ncbi:MAG: 4-hydroxy-tetrahydrodipicolinate reductase [Verrucomicrobiales bacterium]|jgi:4-hydroxy-tetrahydrodipicolinate reductase|nr:4-hydroxy-tetrahydrodipicolinate reductase [Verrucomicrobiales bacterium]
MSTRILMVGAKGRMGQAIVRLARAAADFAVAGEADLGDALPPLLADADAVIDFSHHGNTLTVARLAADRGVPLVVGTTGHDEAVKQQVLACGDRIPLIFSANYSVGVNTLFYLTQIAAAVLRDGFDVEVVEMHHRHKRDAPSGTARTLVEILAAAQGSTSAALAQHGRVGEPGPRSAAEIGVHALRGGDVVGDHTVIFAADGERVELAHKASSRDTFAAGALRAAAWLQGRAPGVYAMFDVLGFK